MLMTSIWLGLVVLAATLMAVDWYLWGPRYRTASEIRPEPARNQVRQGGYQVRLPNAA